MSVLQIFFIVSGLIIFISAFDIAKRQKFNALHFFVFLMVGSGLLLFTIFPKTLEILGSIFGLQRGADALVYGSIIFIFYFILLLLRKTEDNLTDVTYLVREIALENRNIRFLKSREVFIIPSYNEGAILIKTIESIYKKGYKNIIVVDDGSRDNTQELLAKYSKKIVILKHLKNRGQGASLETGFEYIRRYSTVDYVISFDADGQHDIDDLKTFEKHLKTYPDIDVFLGSRFLGDGIGNIPFSRKCILKLGIMFTFFLSKIRLSDTHNGFRVIKRPVLDDLHISIDGMGHASEILDIIATKKIAFREVPVTINYTEYSKAKGQSSGNALNIGLRFIWSKFFK